MDVKDLGVIDKYLCYTTYNKKYNLSSTLQAFAHPMSLWSRDHEESEAEVWYHEHPPSSSVSTY